MPRPISVRLDDDATRALHQLEASGLTRSDAVGLSLVAAAERLGLQSALTAEVAALEADAQDRQEMADVANLMESLRSPG